MNPVSRPTIIHISDVFGVITPQSEFKFDPRADMEAAIKTKLKALMQREKERMEALAAKAEPEKAGYFAKIALQIVHNLQINIHRVHFLYEDRSSLENQPFEIGVIMRHFSIRTKASEHGSEDEKSEDNASQERDGLLFKTVRIDGLGIYARTSTTVTSSNVFASSSQLRDEMMRVFASTTSTTPFMLLPFAGTIELALNDTKTIDRREHAVIDMDMCLDPLRVRFTKAQYASVLAAADSLSNYKAYCSFRAQYRPKDGSRPTKNPRAWWQYAINATKERVRDSAKRRSWVRVLRLHRDRTRYVPAFAAVLRDDPSLETFHDPKKKETLVASEDEWKTVEHLERHLELNEIWYFRTLARKRVDHEAEVRGVRDALEREENRLNKESNSSWFGGWFASADDENENGDALRREKELRDRRERDAKRIEQMESDFKEAESLLRYDPDEIPFWKQMKAMDKMATVRFRQKAISVTLLDDDGTSEVTTTTVRDIFADVTVRVSHVECVLRVRDVSVSDNVVKGTSYPSIVNVTTASTSGESKPFLEMIAKANPPDDESTIARIRCALQPLNVVVSLPLCQRVLRFFDTKPVNLNALRDMLLEKVATLRKSAKSGMYDTMKKRKTLGLDVEMTWPVGRIIVPVDPKVASASSGVLVANLGKLNIATVSKTEDRYRADLKNIDIVLDGVSLVKPFSIHNEISLCLQPKLGVDASTQLNTTMSDVCVVIRRRTCHDVVCLVDAVLDIMPTPSRVALERSKRVLAARRKRRSMWKEIKQKADESRSRHQLAYRQREIDMQKRVHQIEQRLKALSVAYVEIRSHALPPMSSTGREKRVRSGRLSRLVSSAMSSSPSKMTRRQQRRVLQIQQAAADEVSEEALALLQQNIVADIRVSISSFSVSLQDVVTCQFVKLSSKIRQRAFDTNIRAALDGVYIYDHVRETEADSSTRYLLQSHALVANAEDKSGSFADLKISRVDMLSPDFLDARADVSVAYASGKLTWKIERGTIAEVVKFFTESLRRVYVGRIKAGQQRLADQITERTTDSVGEISARGETEQFEEVIGVEKRMNDYMERARFDLKLSLEQTDIHLMRVDGTELCKAEIHGLSASCTQRTTSVHVRAAFDSFRVEEGTSEMLCVPPIELRFAHIKSNSSEFRGFNVDVSVNVHTDLRVTFVNRFVGDAVRFATTGPIVHAAKELAEMSVVKSAIKIASEKSNDVKVAVRRSAVREIESATVREEIPLLPRVSLRFGRVALHMPTSSTRGMTLRLSSLAIRNSEANESGTFDRQTLSDLRLGIVGLSMYTQDHALVGKTDAKLRFTVETAKRVSIKGSLSTIRVAVSPEHIRMLTVELLRDNLSVKSAPERKQAIVTKDERGSKPIGVKKPCVRVDFRADGLAIQLLRSGKGYVRSKDYLWAGETDTGTIASSFFDDGLLALRVNALRLRFVGTEDKINATAQLPSIRLYRTKEREPFFKLDVQKAQEFAVMVHLTEGKPRRVNVSYPGLTSSLMSSSTAYLSASTVHGSITLEPGDMFMTPLDVVLTDHVSSSPFALAEIRALRFNATCPKKSCIPFLNSGDNAIDASFAISNAAISISNKFARDVLPNLMSIAADLKDRVGAFAVMTGKKEKKSEVVTSALEKNKTKRAMRLDVDVVMRLRLLDTLKVLKERSSRPYFLMILLNPKARLTSVGPKMSVNMTVASISLEQQLRKESASDRSMIVTNETDRGRKELSMSLSRRTYVAARVGSKRPDRVGLRVQIPPLVVRADTMLIIDLLDFVESTVRKSEKNDDGDGKKSEDGKDETDKSPRLAIDPAFILSDAELLLYFDVNSDLHELMTKLNVVRHRYTALEPLIAIMNLFGEMIGEIDGASLYLYKYEKRKKIMSTKELVSSIKTHYVDEMGSPVKWLAIAKACGALGAVSALTGAVDGVLTFGTGLLETAQTGDVTKALSGTVGLVGKTATGVGDGLSSVLRGVETGLNHLGGNEHQNKKKRAENVVDGVFDGVSGVGNALVDGVTGFVTKNKAALDESDGSVLGTVGAIATGTTQATVGALTGTVGSLFGAVRSTIDGATSTTKNATSWFGGA